MLAEERGPPTSSTTAATKRSDEAVEGVEVRKEEDQKSGMKRKRHQGLRSDSAG